MAQKRYDVKQVRVQMTGAPYIQITRSADEWWQVPETIEATVEVDGYRVELVTGLDDSLSPTLIRATVERDPNGPSMSEILRLPTDRILAEVVNRAAIQWHRDTERGTWRMTRAGGIPGAAGHAITRGRRTRAQSALIEQQVEQVMALWPEAEKQAAPIEFIRQQLGLSRRTAQRRVEKALERMERKDN